MINLLPEDRKHEIEAGRTNVILLRYNVLAVVALILLVMSYALFYFILHNTQQNAVTTSDNNSKKAAGFSSVKRDADEYRNNLSIASAILGKSVNYTSVIFAITELVPDGVILDGINLDSTDFGTQTSFSAHAKTYAEATKLKDNFQKNKLFSNVFFQSLTDDSSSETSSNKAYPIAVTISAKLSREVVR